MLNPSKALPWTYGTGSKKKLLILLVPPLKIV
jgi:hypothetical protein